MPLPRLDAALDAQAALRTPPPSPVRSYYDALQQQAAGRGARDRFVDWTPDMSPPFALGAGADPEAALVGSPLGARAGLTFKAPPVVAWTGGAGEVGEPRGKSEDPIETDMRRLCDEYRMQQQKEG
ncbi:unnamed protein product [Prorocentrum cordatum]|uniref:Uncharacterized protein n=1 Tax=Prorocentrum cordatum TaxID=2364126 RepID=A0ABN9QYW9_9DINO|nr:unnamed protein product [Polarella glacialis]